MTDVNEQPFSAAREQPDERPAHMGCLQTIVRLARQDVHAHGYRSADGSFAYHLVPEPLTDDRLRRHLAGHYPVGVYPMTPGSTTTSLADFDLDDHEAAIPQATMAAVAHQLAAAATSHGLQTLPVRSGGGHGIHLLLWWDRPQVAADVRALMASILESVDLAGIKVEIFPKQDSVDQGKYGNLFALPFARASVPLDSAMQPTKEPLSWPPSVAVPPAPDDPARQKKFNGGAPPPNDDPKRAFAYGRGLLHKATLRLSKLPIGERNEQIGIVTLQLGHYAWTEAYDKEEAYMAVRRACLGSANNYINEHDDFDSRFNRAWAEGVADPWLLPERDPQNAGSSAPPETDAWPPLDRALLETSTARPSFPLGRIPAGLWQEWIADAAKGANAPVDYVAMSLFTVAASVIGNARRASPWPSWSEACALWIALVGPPSAKKSPAIDVGRRPLDELEKEINGDWDERLRAYERDKEAAKQLRDRWKNSVKDAVNQGHGLGPGHSPPDIPVEAMEPDKPQRRMLYVNDATPERAGALCATNPKGLLLMRDELTGWIEGMNRYSHSKSESEQAFWLEVYGGRPWHAERVDADRSVRTDLMLYSILGGIQPAKLGSILKNDDGMAARFLYVWPQPIPFERPQISPHLQRDILDALRRLHKLSWRRIEKDEPPINLPLDPRALVAFEDWIRETKRLEKPGMSALYVGWLGKLPGLALRLALVLHHLNWCQEAGRPEPKQICLQFMTDAIELLREYVIPMAQYTFREATFSLSDRVRKTIRWILRERRTVIGLRQLYMEAGAPCNCDSRSVGRDDAIAIIECLEQHGWLRPITVDTVHKRGRPPVQWAVNPQAMDETIPGA